MTRAPSCAAHETLQLGVCRRGCDATPNTACSSGCVLGAWEMGVFSKSAEKGRYGERERVMLNTPVNLASAC